MTTQEHLPQPEHFSAQTGSDSAPGRPWETMYRAERKKSRILGASTVAASLLAVGLGAWGLNGQGDSVASGPGQMGGNSTSQFAPPGAAGTLPGPGGMGQDLGTILLNSDGSVNTDAVARFVASMPSGALDQILAMAVSNGEITEEQADQIADAAGSSSSTDSTSGQDT